jgi:hypothetical protein
LGGGGGGGVVGEGGDGMSVGNWKYTK